MIYKVWNMDEESIDDALLIDADSPQEAGEVWVSTVLAGEGIESYEIMVADEAGDEFEVTVDVDWEPTYSSYAIKVKK